MARHDNRRLKPEEEAIFQELTDKDPNGLITPASVVEAAVPIASPLHRFFTWDDHEAAQKQRINEAQRLLQTYVVYNEEVKQEMRVFTSLERDRFSGGYRWTMDVVQSDLREELLQTALKELASLQRKYEGLEALSQVWSSVNRVKSKNAATVPSR